MASANGSWSTSDSTTRTRQRHRSPRKTGSWNSRVKLSSRRCSRRACRSRPSGRRLTYSANSIGSRTSADEQDQGGQLEADRGQPVSRRRRARPRALSAAGGGSPTSGPRRLSGRNVEVIGGYCSSFAVWVIDWATCSGDLEPAISAATLSLTSWPTAGGVGLVEVELEAGGGLQLRLYGLECWGRSSALLRARDARAACSVFLTSSSVGGLGGEELQEVDGGLRRALAQGVPAASTEHLGDRALAALDRREREEAEVRRRAPCPRRPPPTGAHWPMSSMAALPLPTAAACPVGVE